MQKTSKLFISAFASCVGLGVIPPAKADGFADKARSDGLSLAIIVDKPYYFYDDAGKVTGSSVETLAKALKGMGVKKLNPTVTEWSSIVPGVKSGRFDVGAGMNITPERCKEVAFTAPVDVAIAALVVKKGNPDRIKDWESFKDDKLKAATYAGGAEYNFMLKAGVPADHIVALPDQNSMVQAVLNGQVQAFNETADAAEHIAEQVPGLEVLKDFHPPKWSYVFGGFPFAKQNAAFVSELNVQIKKMVNSGEAQKIQEKFGSKTAAETQELLKSAPEDACAVKPE
ncbi:transporter substrate-binding domain-containing protein [Mesorhizobium australicum]|uniref:transporter substrate-binding domain-containing protein n=1 Tax=Mesorhizobium australicum TaxID=536018 RepID=UPI00333C7A2A